MSDHYEVILTGGGPWGIRLQGGKDFGVPLNISRITPGSKAALKGVRERDRILSINNHSTESLTHLEAQNLIKGAGESLQLGLKRFSGAPMGGAKNTAPSAASATSATSHSAPVNALERPKKPPAAPSPTMSARDYARRKQEELENYKKDQEKPETKVESDVLKMLKKTTVQDDASEPTGLSQRKPPTEPEQQSDLSTNSDAQGSNLFPKLRSVPRNTDQRPSTVSSDDDEVFPPPPPLNDPDRPQSQSSVFRLLDNAVKEGRPDLVRTGLDSKTRTGTPPGSPHTSRRPVNNNNSSSFNKAPIPSGPQAINSSVPQPPAAPPYSAPKSPRAPRYSPQAAPRSSQPSGYTPQATPPRASQGPTPRVSAPVNRPAAGGAGVGGIGNEAVCEECHQTIDGSIVSAVGKTWHPEHFCCSSCQSSLQNQAFSQENNQLFCEKCYEQFLAPKCAKCGGAISGSCVNALDKSWHPEHFVCSSCNQKFVGGQFLVDSGHPYCAKCFENLFSVRCGKCNQPIGGGDSYLEALNMTWHSDCFACAQCNVVLGGKGFYMKQGLPVCSQHK